MNLLASLLRTVVPLAVGLVLTITGALGIDADSTAVAAGVTAALTAAYYLLLRLAEAGAERIGWEPLRLVAGVLLGWARPPTYEPPGTSTLKVRLDTAAFSAELREVIERNLRFGDKAKGV